MTAFRESYLYRQGASAQTKTVVSTRFKIFAHAVGVGKFQRMGVTSAFNISESRTIDVVRGLGYGDQVAELVPGVPSFCASAAVLNIPLCEKDQELHIIPGTYSPTEAFAYPGVKVFMKNNLPETLAAARERKLSVRMVENCGTPDQHVYRSLDEMPENAGYYSRVIVKEDGQ